MGGEVGVIPKIARRVDTELAIVYQVAPNSFP
jgi:hypothetical protein